MSGLLMLLLTVAVIAIVLLIADLVMRRIGADQTLRWLALLVVLIVMLLLAWSRVGW